MIVAARENHPLFGCELVSTSVASVVFSVKLIPELQDLSLFLVLVAALINGASNDATNHGINLRENYNLISKNPAA